MVQLESVIEAVRASVPIKPDSNVAAVKEAYELGVFVL
jgi:hypothetical protein